jgi:predicted acylesterase/phospholipase RssA
MQSTYFSVDNTPHVLISEAVRASMTVPFLFKPVEIGDEFYIDGGINDGIPINVFNNTNVSPDAVLITAISRTIDKCHENKAQLPTMIKYMSLMFQANMANIQSMYLINKKYKYLHQIYNCPVSFAPLVWADNELVLKITEEEIDESIALGYTEIQKFIAKHETSTLTSLQ